MKYIILSRPRSGTFMLASMLGDCGAEWFHPNVKPQLLNLALGFTNPWRIFNGVVVHYHHAPRALELLEQPYKVVHLVRKDELARIMSLIAATASGIWHIRCDEQQPQPSDADRQHIVRLRDVDDLMAFAKLNQHAVDELNINIDVEIEYESLVNGSGLEAVCNVLQRNVEDLKPPACTTSKPYQEVIANWQEVEAYVKSTLK